MHNIKWQNLPCLWCRRAFNSVGCRYVWLVLHCFCTGGLISTWRAETEWVCGLCAETWCSRRALESTYLPYQYYLTFSLKCHGKKKIKLRGNDQTGAHCSLLLSFPLSLSPAPMLQSIASVTLTAPGPWHKSLRNRWISNKVSSCSSWYSSLTRAATRLPSLLSKSATYHQGQEFQDNFKMQIYCRLLSKSSAVCMVLFCVQHSPLQSN